MALSNFPIIAVIFKSGPFALFILLLTVAFSVISLAVILHKWRALQATRLANGQFLKRFNTAARLAEVPASPNPVSVGPLEGLFRTGLDEFNRLIQSVSGYADDKVNNFFVETQFAIAKDSLEKTASEEVEKSDRYLVLLAVTSTVCPLLGLLGTVWGITHAFTEIGRQGNASLNVVAPGIAEALVTTIFGIAVAIPAVIGYNFFATKNRGLESEAYNFSSHLLNKIKIDFFDVLYGGRRK